MTLDRSVLWAMLRGQRPWRELHWLSLMPRTTVTAVGEGPPPPESVRFEPVRYRQPVHRFVEAGALAWMRDLRSVPGSYDWWASLEPFSLVTGQVAGQARRRGARQAVMVWHNFSGTPLYRLPPYRRAWLRARHADLFLCLVHAAREHLLEMGVPAERCAVVHPGVDVRMFVPPQSPTVEPVCVFASPLASNKGIDRVLQAFSLVGARLPEARLVVAGRGPLESMVRSAAEADPRITFLGSLDRAGVVRVLQGGALFVTAPRANRVWNEQFGLAYVEAMACGLPVVTTVCGSNHEAVREPNLRVADEPGALADAMLSFLTDPAHRTAVGAANRAYVVAHHDERVQAAAMGAAFDAAEQRQRSA
jgi:glycosyltransferase involved in cell wall biosynthesis